jgi:orotate phosphoribosyltransferase
VDALRSSGAQVKGMLAVFSYNFSIAKDNFKESKVELNTLSNYDYLLEQALESGLITSAEAEMLTEWRVAPQNWKP